MMRNLTLAAVAAVALQTPLLAQQSGGAASTPGRDAGQGQSTGGQSTGGQSTTTGQGRDQSGSQSGVGRGRSVSDGQNTTARGRVPGSAGKGAINGNLFLQVAAGCGIAEVALSEMGLQKATSQELKQFSQRMIDEHTRVNGELRTIAGNMRMQMPQGLDPKATLCAQNLAGLSGEEFDKCYAKAQLVAHMEALSMYEAAAERTQDAVVRTFASRTVPHIREHLNMIKPIAKKYEKDSEQGRQGGADADRDRTGRDGESDSKSGTNARRNREGGDGQPSGARPGASPGTNPGGSTKRDQ